MVTPYPPSTGEIMAMLQFVTTWAEWHAGDFAEWMRYLPNRPARQAHIDNMHVYAKQLKETGFTGDSHENK